MELESGKLEMQAEIWDNGCIVFLKRRGINIV